MHREWLQNALAQLGVSAKDCREEILGYLVGIKGRKEWKFLAQPSATVEDLCEDLKLQTKSTTIEVSKDVCKKRIIDVKEEVDIIIENKQMLYLEIESIQMQPLAKKMEEKETALAVALQRIGTKKRTCQLCKTGIAAYKRKKDILICTKEKILCTQCYKDFHWNKKGEKKYEDFTYDIKEE
ncbi:hypothetical protein NEMIN01_0707 [Nematocida minor]|uniref:uncharacterized protein n=1 Tax=Nematocida minor TaxID=1912983 RepID=UPI002220743C|nr:uncharacterized protein NEMIN01_0707 [Nematocida minor]KAI5189844.1 hypothetical protein NEMIN01_0707 [Nematocida minor]